jgi:hypothetical protein
MGKGFIPRETFEEHWHHVMGGDLEKGPKLMRLGIFIRGEKPVEPQRFKDVQLDQLDFSKMGSMNLIVTQFQGVLLPYDFVNELRDLWETGILRPNFFIFLRKDNYGRLSVMEGGRLQDEENVMEVNALIAALAGLSATVAESVQTKAESAIQAAMAGDFGLTTTDIERIAHKLPPNHSAVIVLFENLWEKKFREIAKKYNGSIINQRIIPSESLAKLVLGQTET